MPAPTTLYFVGPDGDPVPVSAANPLPTLGGAAVDAVTSVNNIEPDEQGNVTLTASDVGAAASSHNHNASQINAGTLNIARIPTGTTSTTVALGDHSHNGLMTGSASAISDLGEEAELSDVIATVNAVLAALRTRGVIPQT